MFIDLFEEEKENPDEFVSFIVFEPASLRIPDNDLLFLGDNVTNLFQDVITSDKFTNNIQDQILVNRLQRINMMLDLLKSNNGLIMTKFLNKIWRRYSFFSNLGELFVAAKEIKRLVPSFEFHESMILDRVVESDEGLDDDDDDNSDDSNEENDSTESKATSSKESH